LLRFWRGAFDFAFDAAKFKETRASVAGSEWTPRSYGRYNAVTDVPPAPATTACGHTNTGAGGRSSKHTASK